MNRVRRLVVAFVLPFALAGAAGGGEPADPPALSGARIDARVVADGEPGIWRFEYRVTHGGARRRIDGLAIDIASDPGRESLSGEGLSVVEPSFKPARELAARFGTAGWYVPVGVAAQPDGWVNGFSAPVQLTWGALRTSARLEPGGAAAEFVATSRGLPGIRDAELVPEIDRPPTDPLVLAASVDAASQKLRTVGPVAPPKQLVLAHYANYVAALRAECATQGWIRAGADVAELDRLLTELRDGLAGPTPGAAAPVASRFIEWVERSSCAEFDCPAGTPLTAEARALLALNVAFLHDRLRAH